MISPDIWRWIAFYILQLVLLVGVTAVVLLLSPMSPPTPSLPFHRRLVWHLNGIATVAFVSGYVHVGLLTAFFPRTYNSYAVACAWRCRDASFIPPSVLAYSLVACGGLLVCIFAFNRQADAKRTFQIALAEQFLVLLATSVIFAAVANGIYVFCTTDYTLISSPSMKPSGSPLLNSLWRLVAVSGIPLLIVFAISRVFPMWKMVASSATVLRYLAVPYLKQDEYMHLEKMKPTLESPERNAGDRVLSILAVSDTHIPANGRSPYKSTRNHQETLSFVKERLDECNETDLVLWCGDVTDQGHDEAWTTAFSITSECKAPMIAISGNHDVHFRRIAIGKIFGRASFDQTKVLEHLNRLTTLSSSSAHGCAIYRAPGASLLVVAFDSNTRPSSTPFTNAIGAVGSAQLGWATDELVKIRTQNEMVLVVLHHHVLVPKLDKTSPFLRCLDARAVMKFAESQRAIALVHGHKHMPYVCWYPYSRDGLDYEMAIVSCGSAHYDAEGPFNGEASASCYRIDIGERGIQRIRIVQVSDQVSNNTDN